MGSGAVDGAESVLARASRCFQSAGGSTVWSVANSTAHSRQHQDGSGLGARASATHWRHLWCARQSTGRYQEEHQRTQRQAIRQIGGDWKAIEKEARRRIKNAHKGEVPGAESFSTLGSNVSNQAQDAKATQRAKHQKYGVYVFAKTRPMLDGTVQSAAATTLSINEFAAHRMACSQTAVSIASAPVLVTQRIANAAERQGLSAAQTVAKVGDATRTRQANEMAADYAQHYSTQAHDQLRAQALNNNASGTQAAMATHYDPMTGQKRLIQSRSFFAGNHYDLPVGQQIASQQMPVVPGDVQAILEHAEELTAAAYGVTRSMALGESASVKAGAEINEDIARKVVEVQGARIAAMTEWVRSHSRFINSLNASNTCVFFSSSPF